MRALYSEIFGQGPDLVLLHGWGLHGGIWEGVRENLAQRFRVHVVDLPGYGLSPELAPYTLAALANSVAQAVPECVHVVAWSMGGQVALQWAGVVPQQIDKMILIGTTPSFAQRADWAHGMSDTVMAEFAASLEQDYEGTLKRFLSLQARSGDEARATITELREKLFTRGRPSIETLRAGLKILSDVDMRDAVADIPHPTLVIHGSHDTLTPPAAGQWLAAAMPQAQFELIGGAAHAPFLSHPQATLDAMDWFLHG